MSRVFNVLVACEESQEVCKAFRELGHNAYSCDLQECSGGHPEWHIQGDVLPLLDGYCCFSTQDCNHHKIAGRWDIIIAHPPCTHLSVSGARHFAEKRKDGRQREAVEFFIACLKAKCERICVENPVNIFSGKYINEHFPDVAEKYGFPVKPTQYIQPWMFGHGETKKTGLWLNGLDKLVPTDVVEGREQRVWKMPPSPDRAKMRSRTYSGIARAMAAQWGGDAREGRNP